MLAAADRRAGETDPHVLGIEHLGWPVTGATATADVLKGFFFILAARTIGNLGPMWMALIGVAVVLGHAFPFYARRMAGRGLAAAAGVLLVLLPIEMITAGTLIVLGSVARQTGLATTVAFASVPGVAAIQDQPWQLVAMAGAIFVLILLRRVEGIADVVRKGISPGRALLYRCVFDSSGPTKRS